MTGQSWRDEYPKYTYYPYSYYLKKEYGEPVYRVSVDAGFSCPNRGPDRAKPGCTYCGEDGSRAPYLGSAVDIRQQVEGAIRFLKQRYNANLYILYFQAFSGTYAANDRLKELYDSALALHPFREMVVSTRPDCITPGNAGLLGSYITESRRIWVELGLQTASDSTLRRINRGHTAEDFLKAYALLKTEGLRITVHLLSGLPGETEADENRTVRLVSSLKPDGLKIHNLHIQYNTPLFTDFLKGEILPPSPGRYLERVIYTLENMPGETVIMRLTTDTPRSRLAAPKNFPDKNRFHERIRQEMIQKGTWQGRLYRRNE
jgi:radical SAM protein (TIGR01212 family)